MSAIGLFYHGFTKSPEQLAEQSRAAEIGDALGCRVVFPASEGRPAYIWQFWPPRRERRGGSRQSRDLARFDTLCAGHTAVVAAGFSAGANFTLTLAHERWQALSAIVCYAGQFRVIGMYDWRGVKLPPALFLCNTDDRAAPLRTNTAKLAAWWAAQGGQAQLHVLPPGGHRWLPDAANPVIVEFLRNILPTSAV